MATIDHTAPRALTRATLLRAAPLLVVGLVLTFTADHSARTGLLALGALGAVSAMVLGGSALRLPAGEALRSLHAGLAVIAGITGLVSLARSDAGLPFLLLVVSGYAVLSGAWELVWGIRRRGAHAFARDAVVVGTGTLALAVIVAVIDEPVAVVGFLGAYAIVVGVFLVIAALSLTGGASQKEHSPS